MKFELKVKAKVVVVSYLIVIYLITLKKKLNITPKNVIVKFGRTEKDRIDNVMKVSFACRLASFVFFNFF